MHPNVLTFVGLLINGAAAWALGTGAFLTAGVVMVIANIFDFIDGKVAERTALASDFGGFWDSVIDRFSDILLFIGLLHLYTELDRSDYVLITALALMFSVMTSYTRARAESIIPKCKVGFMERPERIVLFMIGAFTNRMAAVMWIILILSIVTVVDRIYFTWRELPNRSDRAPPRRADDVQAGPRATRVGDMARTVLDLRARNLAIRSDGDCDPCVRMDHAPRMAWRPDGGRSRPARSAARTRVVVPD